MIKLEEQFITAALYESALYYQHCSLPPALYEYLSLSNNRSSRPELFCRQGILRNFAKFPGKHLCQRPCDFIKKSLWHRWILRNFSEHLFYRAPLMAASARFVDLLISSQLKSTYVASESFLKSSCKWR